MSEVTETRADVSQAHRRVHQALADNKRVEILVTLMAASIFLVAAAMLATSSWIGAPIFAWGGLALGSVFQGAIKVIMRMKRENLMLQSLPVIVRVLPPAEAAQEMMARLRSESGAG